MCLLHKPAPSPISRSIGCSSDADEPPPPTTTTFFILDGFLIHGPSAAPRLQCSAQPDINWGPAPTLSLFLSFSSFSLSLAVSLSLSVMPSIFLNLPVCRAFSFSLSFANPAGDFCTFSQSYRVIVWTRGKRFLLLKMID